MGKGVISQFLRNGILIAKYGDFIITDSDPFFVPGFMKSTSGRKNISPYFKYIAWLYPPVQMLLPNQVMTMREMGLAMINSVQKGYPKQILEIKDVKTLARA
jgi:hypothetical protein